MKIRVANTSETICALFVLAFFVPQLPGCVASHSAKVGRIVDAETGQGMSGVYVVASASFDAEASVHGSVHGNPYRALVRSGERGEFYIPSTWMAVKFAMPWQHPREKWQVTAILPGYMVAGD